MLATKLETAFYELFGDLAKQTMGECQVFKRVRRFDPVSLVATFVIGLLSNPRASDKDLADTAARLGVSVTRQAIRNRITEEFANAMKGLFQKAVTRIVGGGDQVLAPILSRFTAVTIRDSSTISLPASQQDTYPGCGGSEVNHGAAAFKLQTEIDLRSGAVTHLQIEPGKSPDAATSRQFAPCRPGELRITDLGYFNLDSFASIHNQKAFFLSRVQMDTKLFTASGILIDLEWLSQQPAGLIDIPITMGVKHRLPCRLIVFRVPEEQANRRKQKRSEASLRKRKREPNTQALQWCEWNLLVTNAPEEMLSEREVIILYRARWQVELLFKRWKSIGQIDLLDGRNDLETMVRLWSRLIGALLQHWLTISNVWFHGPSHSLYQVAKRVREIANDLIKAILDPAQFENTIQLFRRLTKYCRHNPRKKPSTFEMLNDPAKLDFRLT
jgi:hypothetical protein